MSDSREKGVWRWCLVWVLLCGCVSAWARNIEVGEFYFSEYSEAVNINFISDSAIIIPKMEDIIIEPPLADATVDEGWRNNVLRIRGNFVPETDYKITIRKGLKNIRNDVLANDVKFRFYVRRQNTFIGYLANGNVVPLGRTDWEMPLKIRNAKKVIGVAHRVYVNNLISYDVDGFLMNKTLEYIGKKVCTVNLPDNQKMKCLFNLSGLIPLDEPGLYSLLFTGEDREDSTANEIIDSTAYHFIVVTDLGLSLFHDPRESKMFLSVLKLSDKSVVAGADIDVYDMNNQLMFRGSTDENGCASLTYSKKNTVADKNAHIVIVRKGKDVNFLVLKTYDDYGMMHHSISTGFESNGFAEPSGPTAFVYLERGTARPGEEIHASAFLRELSPSGYRPVEGFPCVVQLKGPDGQILATKKMKTGEQGGLFTSFKLDINALTGRYEVNVGIEEGTELGYASFLISTYVPDNILVDISMNSSAVKEGDDLIGTVSARYYYGAPAKDLSLHAWYSTSYASEPPHWKGYEVGDKEGSAYLEKVECSFKKLGEKREIPYEWKKEKAKSFYPQELSLIAVVQEPDGRAVANSESALVDFSDWYLGIKKEDTDEKDVVFQYKALASRKDVEPKFSACNGVVELKKIAWRYEQTEKDGLYSNEWIQTVTPYGKPLDIELKTSQGQFTVPNLPNGHYEMVVTVGTDIRTKMEFWHWQGESGRRVSNPNVMTFKTDKDYYLPGDTAKLTFDASGDGQAMVAFGPSGMDGGYICPVKEGENTVSVRIPDNLQTVRYYCGVSVVTGKDYTNDRVFGMAALKVKQEVRKLNVELNAPELGRPGKPMDIVVGLSDSKGKPVSGLAHVFLVDVGVLSLTKFKTPDIWGYFHGSWNCRMKFTDMYENIYPDLKIEGAVKIGGDGVSAVFRDKMAELKMKKSAVVVLDPVKTDVNGKATLHLTLPEHLGAMRIMCVASADALVGSGEKEVILRDEIDVLASGPRAVAPGDEFECTFVLNNFDLPDGAYEFFLKVPEGLKAEKTLIKGELKKGVAETCRVSFQTGEYLGACELVYTLSMGKIDKSGSLDINIRSANPPVAESHSAVVKPGEKKILTLSSKEWLAGSAKGKVSIADSPVAGLTDCLDWLNSYPHGCLEQTVSCAFPFLCLPQLKAAGVIDEAEEKTHDGKLDATIRRIQTMYLGRGKFSLWPCSDHEHEDAGLYASHFLFAAVQSCDVNSSWLDKIEKHSLQMLAEDASEPIAKRAYACYVMSLRESENGMREEKRYNAIHNILSSKSIGMHTFLAGAALAKNGYAAEAMPYLKKSLEENVWRSDEELLCFSDYASRLGMALRIVMDLMPDDDYATKLATELNHELSGRGDGWRTTQANAWACMGLASYAAYYKCDGVKGTVSLNGKADAPLTKGSRTYTLKQGEELEVMNEGTAPLFLNFNQNGIRRAAPETGSQGIRIRRDYLNSDGVSVHHAKQGDLLVVRLSVDSVCPMKDLVITDLLPGGLEIEDSNLATRVSATKKADEKVEKNIRLEYTDLRDDRFLAYFNVKNRGKAEITYTVRAVSRGKYVIPPAIVEAMYSPDFKGSFSVDGVLVVE